MINKKRVELYMQRKARLTDTHQDAESSDFDMDDCDFKLDGTEGSFECKLSAEELAEELKKNKLNKHVVEVIKMEDLVIPELPDLSLDSFNNEAFAKWSEVKKKERDLNSKEKQEIREEIRNTKNLVVTTPQTMAPILPVTMTSSIDQFAGRTIVSVNDLTLEEVKVVVKLALTFKKFKASGLKMPQFLDDKIVCLFFGEPSTRTRCSFQSATYHLGGKVIVVDNDASCSTSKGEALYDSIRIMGGYGDAVVIRSKETGSIAALKGKLDFPIISGGDGAGEHPTQALLDLTTMTAERPDMFDPNRTEVIKVTMCGDLKHGRTVHSLAKLLTKIPKIEITFVAPPSLQPEDHFFKSLPSTCSYRQLPELDISCGRSDFLYVTRLQKERLSEEERNSNQYDLHINLKLLVSIQAKPTLRIMHPLPRVGEIHPEIDATQHQLYFEQAHNGLFARMAVLSLCLSNDRVTLFSLLAQNW